MSGREKNTSLASGAIGRQFEPGIAHLAAVQALEYHGTTSRTIEERKVVRYREKYKLLPVQAKDGTTVYYIRFYDPRTGRRKSFLN